MSLMNVTLFGFALKQERETNRVVVAHSFNPSTQVAEVGRSLEASLVYED